MPLFLSEEEFRRCSGDAQLVAEKADDFIRGLYNQINTVKAEADAASITLEQTSSLIEQKYVSLSTDYDSLQSQYEELKSSLEKRSSEFGLLQTEKQQLHLKSIEKDGEIERLTRDSTELHKSKRQLMESLEQKDLEVSEKNVTIKSYLDKIVNLSESVASKEARLGELESELRRVQATSARALQEKELLERHNSWLNEELTAKVDSLVQLRKSNGEFEAIMCSKLTDAEKKFQESSSSLKFYKDRVKDLEEKLASTEKDLLAAKEAAAASEKHFSAELSTVNKLVDLYKESSEEWSKKAGELEGVIKALETHLKQVESEYKDRLENEISYRKGVEKENADLKEKLQSTQVEIEKMRKENELNQLPLSSFTLELPPTSVDRNEITVDDRAIVPSIPSGVSGTALAASLLRDGWSLAKMYSKYQEAVDALRHEQLGRKQTQTLLQRVLYEIEEKSAAIMDEREEHERLGEAYSALEEKLHHSLSEHSALETIIHELKANLKRQERENDFAQKEITDLQKQVSILLKECRDVQLRCGSAAQYGDGGPTSGPIVPLNNESNVEDVLSERLLTLKDINGLVEQNVQLRSLVRKLSDQIADKEAELQEKYENELKKHSEDTALKVTAVLERAQEQAQMIESLHTSVAMYKKLYEEEHKLQEHGNRAHPSHPQEIVPEQGSRMAMLLDDSSHDISRKVQEHAIHRLKSLEEDMAKSRGEIISLRAERDKFALEAQFAQEKLDRFMKEFEHQRTEQNGVIARNVEFSQLIVDYQRKLRESAEALDESNELSRKLKMEVSILKNEKEILLSSEKRASEEVRSLSERVHRLQASLDTIQSAEEVREEARGIEKRKQEEHISKIEREWAEAKKELQEQRDTVRNLTIDRETTLKDALRYVEELSKDLANAMKSVAAAESRAAVAEARCSDLEKILESARTKNSDGADVAEPSASGDKILVHYQEQVEKLRAEAQASNEHMLEYKKIAEVNEAAIRHTELASQKFKDESDKAMRSLEANLQSLQERINELENECKLKAEETISSDAGKDQALMEAFSEIASLKDNCSTKMSEISVMESQISALREDLEREHQRWRAAQDNYERQVILQSETIQELTKTSQALASAQDATTELRKAVDALTNENSELKTKWETEKLAIEVYKSDADRKYNEVNELNKMLHCRLEALHIQIANRERNTASGSESLADDDGLQNIVNYLRRSKDLAETEISMLKQQNIRLQSQLEMALKSAEEAQTTLQTERAKSRSSLFSEDEFKSLQLQVRELTLLRESNVQLREENRHNFEECQKLRETLQIVKIDTENMEKRIREKDAELEAYRKEVEVLKMEKGQLEKRIDEMMEKYKEVNVDDYNRLKESFRQMEMSFKEKDAQLDDIKKQLSERKHAISVLERDLGISRTEISEKETRINEILQTEASLKSEIDKFKLSESSLKSEVEKFKRANLSARRKNEKEKEDLNKELLSISKQLEEAKQVKRTPVDSAAEETIREKEKEKDARIHILEKTVEKLREELKKEREEVKMEKEKHVKEKERHARRSKVIADSCELSAQQREKLSTELSKHKHALKLLQDEVEKLKNTGGSRQEGTSAVPHLSLTVLDDFASIYFQAVENFEHEAQRHAVDVDSVIPDTQENISAAGPVATSLPNTPAIPTPNVPPIRSSEEKEKRPLQKANVKTGRKLVRPSIRPKEPQGEVEMVEADDTNAGMSSQNTESEGNAVIQAASVRKRPSSSISSDMQEDVPALVEPSSDLPAHLAKKSRGSENQQEGDEEPSVVPTKLSEAVAVDELPEDAGNLQQGATEDESVDAEKAECETTIEQADEPAGDEQMLVELSTDAGEATDEKLEKTNETAFFDDQLRFQTEQDIQQIVTEAGDREESELVGDIADNDGDSSLSNEMAGAGTEEVQAEQSGDPENSPIADQSGNDAGLEGGEFDPSQTPPQEEKNTDMTEDIPDSSNKPDEDADPASETVPASAPGSTVGSTDATEEPSAGPVDVGSSEQGRTTTPPDTGGKVINLQERAKEKAHLRQRAMTASPPPAAPPPARGRARPSRSVRIRGGRTTRGPSPSR